MNKIFDIIPKDKLKHFGFGFALGLFCVVFAIVAGYYKEATDRKNGSQFDICDMLATWLGGAAGQCASFLLIGIL